MSGKTPPNLQVHTPGYIGYNGWVLSNGSMPGYSEYAKQFRLMANMPSFKVSRLSYMADTLVTNTLRWRDAVKPLSPEEKLDV